MLVHALLFALLASARQVPGVAAAAGIPVAPPPGLRGALPGATHDRTPTPQRCLSAGACVKTPTRRRDGDAAVAAYLEAARRVRAASDSALAAYEVRLYQRASVDATAGPFARERTLLRVERVERVRWSRGSEPRIEVLAVHRTVPALHGTRPRNAPVDAAGELIELPSLPFYPGSGALWPESLLGPSAADSLDSVVDPLAPGAWDLYRYSLRRPRAVRTPDGGSRMLQELRIRPHAPHPTLLVADLWFDPRTLALVRAAYRPSSPIDVIARKLTPVQRTGVLRWTSPARVAVRSIVVEYEPRGDSIALPRSRSFEAVLDVPFVRVPTLQPHLISRLLDAGALGVMVPLVEAPEQAARIVEAAKYPPSGHRGVSGGLAHDDYRGDDVAGTMRLANIETLLIAQIESAQGVDRAREIAAVEGIDVLWMGQMDLSTSLGVAGQYGHPTYLAALEAIVAAENDFLRSCLRNLPTARKS